MEINTRSSDHIKPILKCHIIKRKAPEIDEEQAREQDSFYGLYSTGGELSIIEPPLSLQSMANMRRESSEIGPVVDAMKVNIERTGWRIVPRPKTTQRNEDLPSNIKKEMAEIENFFNNCVLDQEVGSFIDLKERAREDYELTGMFFIEVLPQRKDPKTPAGLKHIPSWTMRITDPDVEFTSYDVPRAVKINDDDWRIDTFPTSKRFRRYVQIDESIGSKIYFKEWNDPRPISVKDGRVISAKNENLDDTQAHEVIFRRVYSATTPYGVPKWYGATYSIYGKRAAEEINYVSLDSNQVPALALLATNVEVTQGSVDRLNEFFEERGQGDRNYSRMILIEAEPVGEGMKDPNAMKLSIERLTSEQNSDAMFKEYFSICDHQVRQSWRVAPLMVGASQDYTKATAVASLSVSEQQVFAPERFSNDELWNDTIIVRLGKAFVKMKSNSPQLTDGFELTQLLATAEGSGGLTPRTSTMIVEDVMNISLPEPDPSIDPDIPFSLTKLREQSKLFQIAQESTQNPNTVKKMLEREDEIAKQKSTLLNVYNTTMAMAGLSETDKADLTAKFFAAYANAG